MGSCGDIVVNAYDGSTAAANKVASVKAFGSLSSGECGYVVYVPANDDTVMTAWYSGPASGHPGDYLEINSQTAQPFAASAGTKKTFDFLPTYDWIK